MVGVDVDGTRVGVVVEVDGGGLARVGATVGDGLRCALGVGVGVDAAKVAVGRPPSAATARAAEKIQTRIKGFY